MRFFTTMTERECFDAQERAAMLNHRLKAIEYHNQLIRDSKLAYAFYALEENRAVLMYEAKMLEDIDWFIKRDPYFPYTTTEVVPVVSTEALVREAQDYLNVEIIPNDSLSKLNFPIKPINPDAEYWLAYKLVKPFSPLLSEEEQNDVHRRTIIAQEGHFDDLEFADDNPVGKPVGILVAQAPLIRVKQHVESCEVFPDVVVTYSRLSTLKQAWQHTINELRQLCRRVPEHSLFD